MKNRILVGLRVIGLKHIVLSIFSICILLILFQFKALRTNENYSFSFTTKKSDFLEPEISPELLDLFQTLSHPLQKGLAMKDLFPYYLKAHFQIESNKEGRFYENKTENDLFYSEWMKKHSCKARHERFHHHHVHVPSPSPHFFALLSRYAEFHKNCTSQVKDWKHEVVQDGNATGCKYLYVIPRFYHGLGNKILSIMSAMVYAMLTQRVLFISENPFADLLCEPFPNSSWIMPFYVPDSRVNEIVTLQNFLKMNASFSYVRTRYGPDFSNEDTQRRLADRPWLWIDSNVYYVPELYLVPSFQTILEQIFPDRLIFTHLSRHFLLPKDYTWRRIMHLKRGYMNGADRLIGMHLRYLVLEERGKHWLNHLDHASYINERVMDCALNNSKSLPFPNIKSFKNLTNETDSIDKFPLISVFIASQFADAHSQFLKGVYFNGGVNGESVSIQHITATHHQNTDIEEHRNAFIEMWLLSFVDDLFTSANSTFSFIAQGLGGQSPWVLNFSPHSQQFPSCTKRGSSEPCHLNFSSLLFKLEGVLSSKNNTRPPFEVCPDKNDSYMLKYIKK